MAKTVNYPQQSPWQSALRTGYTFLWTPANGAIGTGTGYGMTWTVPAVGLGPTVAHSNPATGGPSVVSQVKRTKFSNVVTTQNQILGVTYNATEDACMWRGDSAGLGGFYFSSRFILNQYKSNQRIFVGLSSSATSVVASDTVAGHVVGLWHDSTDPDSGTNAMNIVTNNNTTALKTNVPLGGSLQSALAFDFELYARPNDSVIYWSLWGVNADTIRSSGSVSSTLPTNTVFMGPQCAGSNGTANTAAADVRFEIVRIYGATHY